MTIETILKKVPFFSRLSDQDLQKLISMGETISLRVNQVVYQEGDESESMFVILDGRVRIYKVDDRGRDLELATLAAGDFFGELALLDSQPRSATVVCLTACEFFVINQIAFMGLLLRSRARIIYSVFADLTGKIRETTEAYFKEELAKRALRAEIEIERHRSLAQMVAGVAHELNTPLGIANTAVDMIATRLSRAEVSDLFSHDKKSQRVLDDMLEAANLTTRNLARAHTLVQNFKKISVNQITESLETVNLPQTVAETVELFKIQARQAKLEIEIENTLADANQVWVGYPGYLTQILLNLLSNIERYAYQDGVGGRVAIVIAAKAMDQTFILTVSDFGQGIASENLSQVFVPFFTTGRGKGGAGLGLAIAHNLVTEALKGSIAVESKRNKGTTFTLTFPQVIS